MQTTNTGSTSTLLCSYQYSAEVSNILRQIEHRCIISIIGRVLRSHGSIQARSTQTIPLISHFYNFFSRNKCKVPPGLTPRKGRSEVRYQNQNDSFIKHCIPQNKTHLNKIMDIYLVYLQKTHKDHHSKKPMKKKTPTNKAISLAVKYNLCLLFFTS